MKMETRLHKSLMAQRVSGSMLERHGASVSKFLLALILVLSYAVPAQATTRITYIHNDHLGTPQVMTDESGAVVWRADYRPFGEADVTVNSLRNDLRFPGQIYDEETGLHYNYFRDYDPGTGRYVQSDPIGLGGGLNTFIYVGSKPTRYSDFYGLDFICDQVRSGIDTTMTCEDTLDNTVTTYNLSEPADNGNPDNPYGANGPLAAGDYLLLPRDSNGRILPVGSPVYTTPGQGVGVVLDPQGNARGIEGGPIGPHIGRRSAGCPLFPPTAEGRRQKEDFYRRFNNNIEHGGTSVTIR